MIQVLPLKGYKSLRALNAFHTLMLGLKMLPAYASEAYEDFYERISKATDEEKVKLIREAALFVQLERDEVEALIGFCSDKNGVPYGPHNVKMLGPDQLIDIIVAVCAEIGKINVGILTEEEKKN